MVFCYLFCQFLVALIIGLSFFLSGLSQMALNKKKSGKNMQEFNIANVKFHLELNISNFKFQKQGCFARYFEKRAVWLNSLKIKGK